jgi:phosphotriesterase-related protein
MEDTMDHASRKKELAGKAQTVLGPVEPADLGITLMHEHLLSYAPHVAKEPAEASQRARFRELVGLDNLGDIRFSGLLNLDNCRLDDVETAIDEAGLFKLAGGSTIVEATSIGIGRDPCGLARIARATGLNIVMGASYYVDETHPPDRRVAERREDEIVDEIARDVLDGADGTDVRAGFIGEVGCSWPLTDNERKVLRASGRAQRLTGAPLMIHPGRGREAPLEIVEVLREVDTDLGRTIMCHVERTLDREDDVKQLAETGCILEYDLFGYENSYYPWDLEVDMPTDAQRLHRIRWLISEGFGERLVISQDVYFKYKLARYGGHGYAHILKNVVPMMRRQGFSEEEIQTILVDTPRRYLTFA